MNWYSKPLGNGMWVDIPSEEIKQGLQPLFESEGRPVEMTVFTRHEAGSLHCEWVAYFSPTPADVTKAAEASPCAWTLREGLKLLAGSNECWSVLFGNA